MKEAKSTPTKAQNRNNGAFFPKGGGQDFFGACVQPKLTVGKSGDSYEREADSVADKVVQRLSKSDQPQHGGQHVDQNSSLASSVTPLVQRKCAECEREEREQQDKDDDTDVQRKPIFESEGEEGDIQRKCSHCEAAEKKAEKLQRKAESGGDVTTPAVEHTLASSKGGGSPLPNHVNKSWSNAFGSDLSSVRIHNGNEAAQMSESLNAQAFTHGTDIYFNTGKYSTNDTAGKHLLAHEITHTIQQKGNTPSSVQREPTTNAPTQPQPLKAEGYELDSSPDKMTLKIEKLHLPDFKERNKAKFKLPVETLKMQRPKLQQVNNWKEAVKSAANIKVADFLKKIKKPNENEAKPEDSKTYFLKSPKSEYRLFGTLEQIQEECYIPNWNRFGERNLHQVDHIVEWQLGGGDVADNYELADAKANMDSGIKIMQERKRATEEAIKTLKDKNPNVPVPKYSEIVGNYIVSYTKIEKWDLSYQGNGKVFWTKEEIKDGKHLEYLQGMTADEISKSKGTPNELVLYVNRSGGSPIRLPIPPQPKEAMWPGIDITGYTINASAGDNDVFGVLKLKLRQNFTKTLKTNKAFEVNFKKIPGLLNTGYLDFAQGQTAISGLLKFEGLSPITIDEFRLDETKGIVLHGIITVDGVPLIAGTQVELNVMGDDLSISKTFTLDEVKDRLPKPFRPTEMSLSVFASTKEGLGVEGTLGFEIKDFGKGELIGIGSGKGFGIKGKFEFDPKLFKSKIEASYIDNKFAFNGSAEVATKMKGLEKLKFDVSYKDELLTGRGSALLSIPGLQEIGLTVKSKGDELLIEGDIKFGKTSHLKSANAKITLLKKGEQWNVGITGDISPDINISGLSITQIVLQYNNGVFDISGAAHFEKGKIKGDFRAGVTNKPVDEKGAKVESEEAAGPLKVYGDGVLNIPMGQGVSAEARLKIKPDGDILIGGKLGLTEDKFIVPEYKSNAPKIFDFEKSIPVASCGVATILLGLKADAGIFYAFDGLKIDKETVVDMPDISLGKLSQIALNAKISMSTGFRAGLEAGVGLVATLQVAIAAIKGTGKLDLKFTALDAKARALAEATFSPEKGIQLKETTVLLALLSKISAQVNLEISLILDLLLTQLTLWSHRWEPDALKAEKDFPLFSGSINLSLKFGDNNSISLDDITSGITSSLGAKARDNETYSAASQMAINGTAPSAAEKTQEAKKTMHEEIKDAYRGGYSAAIFKFDQTVNQPYFERRVAAWNIIEANKGLDPDQKRFLETEIRRYEFEEYEAFGKFLERDKSFNNASKSILIEDFIRFRPTLGATEHANLKSWLQPSASPSTSPVQRKPISDSGQEEREDGTLQRKQDGNATTSAGVEATIAASKGKGEGIPHATRNEMESSFNADFSDVRIHTDSTSAAMNENLQAKAFTHDNNIYFNSGNFKPEEPEGKRLLAHELTHVVQQGKGQGPDDIQRDEQKTPPSKDTPPVKTLPVKDPNANGNQIPISPPKPSNPIIYTGNTQGAHSGDPFEKGVSPKEFLPFDTGADAWTGYLNSVADSMNAFGPSVNGTMKQDIVAPYSTPSGKDFVNKVGYATEAEGKSNVGSLKSSTGLQASYDFTKYEWIPYYEGIKQLDPPTHGRVFYPVEVAYVQSVTYTDAKQRKVTLEVRGKVIFTPDQWLKALGLKLGLLPPSALMGLTGDFGAYEWTFNGKGPKFSYHDDNKANGEKTNLDALSKLQPQKELHGTQLPSVTFVKPYITPGEQFTAIQQYLDTVDKINEDYLASVKDKSRPKIERGDDAVSIGGDMQPTRTGEPASSSGEIPTWLMVLGGVLAAVVVVGLIILLIPEIAAGLVAVAGYFGVTLALATAVKIVVAGLFIGSFIMSLVHRIKEGWGKYSFLKILGVSVLDAIGIGPVIECVTDTSLLTEEDLNRGAFRRSFDCTMGIAGLIGSLMGVKGFFRKSPVAPVDSPTTTTTTDIAPPPEPAKVPEPIKQPEPVKPDEPAPDPWADQPAQDTQAPKDNPPPASDPVKEPVADQPAPTPDEPAKDPLSGGTPKDESPVPSSDQQPTPPSDKQPTPSSDQKPAPSDKQPVPAPGRPKRRIVVTVEKKPPVPDNAPPPPKTKAPTSKAKPGKTEKAGPVEKPDTAKPVPGDEPDITPDNIDDMKPGTQVSVPVKGRSRAEVVEVNKDTIVLKVRSKSSSSDIVNTLPKKTFKGWLEAKTAFVYSKLRAYLMNNRPKHPESMIEKVWNEAAKNSPDGQVRDPNPPHEILTWDKARGRYDQWHMGHRKGFEYRKLVDRLVNGEIDFEGFMKEYLDPKNYWPEDPIKNMSHGHEAE